MNRVQRMWGPPLGWVAMAGLGVMSGCGGSSHHNATPSISNVADQTLDPDMSTDALQFSISDQETAADQLRVEVSSSNATLVPDAGIALTGSGNSRAVTVTPAPDQYGSTTVTLTVVDAHGMRATSQFVITVRDTRAAFTTTMRELYRQSENGAPADISSAKAAFASTDDPGAYDDLFAAP